MSPRLGFTSRPAEPGSAVEVKLMEDDNAARFTERSRERIVLDEAAHEVRFRA
jgi:hypothetical protein